MSEQSNKSLEEQQRDDNRNDSQDTGTAVNDQSYVEGHQEEHVPKGQGVDEEPLSIESPSRSRSASPCEHSTEFASDKNKDPGINKEAVA